MENQTFIPSRHFFKKLPILIAVALFLAIPFNIFVFRYATSLLPEPEKAAQAAEPQTVEKPAPGELKPKGRSGRKPVQPQLAEARLGDGTDINDVYAICDSGIDNLMIRRKPTRTAGYVGRVPHGARVRVLERGFNPETVAGIAAEWWKIECGGITGYCFSGYLKLEGGSGPAPETLIKSDLPITKFFNDEN